MPNWCYTSYVCVGSERDTRDLYEKMRALSKRTASLLPNDFGKEWMGNVVAALGGKWQDIGAIAAYCVFPKKPCIHVQRTLDTQLALF